MAVTFQSALPARRLQALTRFAAASILAALAGTACGQSVRLTRGEGARIFPDARTYRVGDSQPSQRPSEVILNGNPIATVCCPAQPGRSVCVTERQIPLGASKAQVLGRYGPPEDGSSPTRLQYAGISFDLDPRDQVEKICVGR